MEEIKLTTENFENEVLNAKGTVLVDFYATWCGPCKMLAPVLEEFANEHEEIKVCKLDVDEATPVAIKYGVASIPTLILFKDGEVVKQTLGYQTKDQLESFVK